MQEIQSIVDIKLFLSVIAALLGSNLAIIIFVARKYMKQIDKDHEKLNALHSDYMVIHRRETGLPFKG